MKTGEPISAGDLGADHIGRIVRYRDNDVTREMSRIVDAELRQVLHDGSATHLYVGIGAEVHVTLPHGEVVMLDPKPIESEVFA